MACLSSRMVFLVGLLATTQAARVSSQSKMIAENRSLDVVPDVVFAGLPEHLVPAMVAKAPVPCHTTQKFSDGQWNVDFVSDGGIVPNLRFHGGFASTWLGHKRLKAYDPVSGQELFQIRTNKAALNPFKLRHSWRVFPPGEAADDSAWTPGAFSQNVLFTMNTDIFGKGFLWMKPEWRIYRGHKRDGKYAYYCVGMVNIMQFWTLNKGKVECWHSQSEYELHKSGQHHSPPVFKMTQKVTNGFRAKRILEMIPCSGAFLAVAAKMLIMDAYDIWIAPGEDTALLQTFSVVWGWSIGDSVHNAGLLGAFLPIPNPCKAAAKR